MISYRVSSIDNLTYDIIPRILHWHLNLTHNSSHIESNESLTGILVRLRDLWEINLRYSRDHLLYANATHLMKSLNNIYIYSYQVPAYFGNSSQLFVLVYIYMYIYIFFMDGGCYLRWMYFQRSQFWPLFIRLPGITKMKRTHLSAYQPNAHTIANGIVVSLEEAWKAVSGTMFCSGCMNNNW